RLRDLLRELRGPRVSEQMGMDPLMQPCALRSRLDDASRRSVVHGLICAALFGSRGVLSHKERGLRFASERVDLFPSEQIGDRVAHDDDSPRTRLSMDNEGRTPRFEADLTPTQRENLRDPATGVIQEAD